jgi:phosphatidylglycerol lysyltransferase
MTELRAISVRLAGGESRAEKGLSLVSSTRGTCPGSRRVIERGGRIDAFANLWAVPCQEELSVDLMRYRHDAPKNVMEALLVHLMQWGKEQGYRRFVLGMAPLAGIEQTAATPLWNRMGAFLYEHGESIYHFQGLRAYKQKFDPVWDPHYLAYPGGLRLRASWPMFRRSSREAIGRFFASNATPRVTETKRLGVSSS